MLRTDTMAIQIVCVSKDGGNHENRHTAISKLGWVGDSKSGYLTRIEMYDWLKQGGSAFVKDAFGNVAYLMTAVTRLGTKYVKTVADETKADNLLSLSECRV
jgi:hypothetical protein